MSTDSSSTSSSSFKLSVYNVAEWKNKLITKALLLNAYAILQGKEKEPDEVTEAKAHRDYMNRVSLLAGYIRDTLTEAQLQTVLRGVDILDIPKVHRTLLAAYKPKTSASSVSLMQELTTLRKKDNETYEELGNRALEVASRLIAQLPARPRYTPELTENVNVTVTASPTIAGESPTLQTVVKKAVIVPSEYDPGYSAADLTNHLALSMIPLSLGGTEPETLLCHTLNHIDEVATDGNATLEHLKRADTLSRNLAMQESATASALTAQSKRPMDRAKAKKAVKKCSIHGPGHSDEQCRAQKNASASKDAAKSADVTHDVDEKALMAQIGHIKTPLVRCSRHSPHRKPTANDPWNPDSGATKHMTSHLKWLRNTVNVCVPITLANDEVVWATKKGQVWFQPVVNGRTGRTIIFNNALYVPDLQNNLFSVLSVVRESKMRVVIEGDKMRFYDREHVLVLTASISGNTGSLDGTTLDNDIEHAFLSHYVEREVLHQCLGHIGKDRLRTLIKKDLATGIVVKPQSKCYTLSRYLGSRLLL